jgi:hypothetical protein
VLALGDLKATQQVSTALVAQGLRVSLAQQLGPGEDTARPGHASREHADPAVAEARISHRSYDPDALPGDLYNFDALWSDMILEDRTVEQAALAIEAAMQCLRPGGIAIHILPFDGQSDDGREEGGRTTVFQRVHLERLALVLISRNFEVGRIKIGAPDIIGFDGEDEPKPVGRFAVIARRPPTVF